MNWRAFFRMQAFFRMAGLLAIGNLVVALAVLWTMGGLGASMGRTGGAGAAAATQRLADVYATDAFRYVITHDYAALNVIVKQTANWPELVYVSVEDAQGRILALSDQSLVGQVWSADLARGIRTTVKVPYEEVVSVMTDPAGDARAKGPIGRVRLGFIADPQPQPTTPALYLLIALAAALVLALPMAFLAMKAANRPVAPAEAEPEQVTRLLRDLKETATEAQRLRGEQARHAEETARLQRERAALADDVRRLEQQIEDERAAAAAEIERGREEAAALRGELDHQAADVASLPAEQDHERTIGTATEPTPAAGNGPHDGDVARHAQYRAVSHIGQV